MAVDIPQLHLDNQLCFALHAASRAVVRAYGPLLEDLGLTYPQYLVMLVLWEHPSPMTVGAIGADLQLDSGTLTPLLKRLELAGWLQRTRDVDDERRVRVSLTAAGRSLRTHAEGVPRAIAARFGMDEPALRRLKRDLERLTAAL